MKMFPRTHVPRARNLPPDEIAQSAKLQVELNCTTTLRYTTSDTIDRQIPLHTHENVPTDTCTLCSKPSALRSRPFGSVAACTTSDCHVGDISTKLCLDEIRTPRGFVALIG